LPSLHPPLPFGLQHQHPHLKLRVCAYHSLVLLPTSWCAHYTGNPFGLTSSFPTPPCGGQHRSPCLSHSYTSPAVACAGVGIRRLRLTTRAPSQLGHLRSATVHYQLCAALCNCLRSLRTPGELVVWYLVLHRFASFRTHHRHTPLTLLRTSPLSTLLVALSHSSFLHRPQYVS